MKTSWGKPVSVIAFCRTLLIVLAVAVCTVAAEDLETVRKKAKGGDAKAQFNLGWMYANGLGVPENDAEAVKWYRKAAEQGDAEAQYNLADMYRKGEGVLRDDVAAYAWYSIAETSGDEDAREEGEATKRDLTPSELKKGQAMAREIFERIVGEAPTWSQQAAETSDISGQPQVSEIVALNQMMKQTVPHRSEKHGLEILFHKDWELVDQQLLTNNPNSVVRAVSVRPVGDVALYARLIPELPVNYSYDSAEESEIQKILRVRVRELKEKHGTNVDIIDAGVTFIDNRKFIHFQLRFRLRFIDDLTVTRVDKYEHVVNRYQYEILTTREDSDEGARIDPWFKLSVYSFRLVK